MAGHLEVCPDCTRRSMWVAQTETKDCGYCPECGAEMTRILAHPRAVVPPEVSARDRSPPRGEAPSGQRGVRQIPTKRR